MDSVMSVLMAFSLLLGWLSHRAETVSLVVPLEFYDAEEVQVWIGIFEGCFEHHSKEGVWMSVESTKFSFEVSVTEEFQLPPQFETS